MSKITIFNEDCIKTLKRFEDENTKINVILTSPPYNTAVPTNTKASLENYVGRYDIYLDDRTRDEYREWIVELFNQFDKVLEKNGVVLWNASYGSDASVDNERIGLLWLTVADIIEKTNFTTADRIIWKKNCALPNNTSANKLTRIVEDVFVFCRKSEYNTFNMNKDVTLMNKNGQMFYKSYFNFIEAKNNDGPCALNKATYSSELCIKLLKLYAKKGDTIYDPFMGTGTTGVAASQLGMNCYGSELSKAQVEYANKRIDEVNSQITFDTFLATEEEQILFE